MMIFRLSGCVRGALVGGIKGFGRKKRSMDKIDGFACAG